MIFIAAQSGKRFAKLPMHDCFCTCSHITKTSEPNEAILVIKVSKLTDDFHPHSLLGFDKFAIKEINQDITFPRVQGYIASTRRRDSRGEILLVFRQPVRS